MPCHVGTAPSKCYWGLSHCGQGHREQRVILGAQWRPLRRAQLSDGAERCPLGLAPSRGLSWAPGSLVAPGHLGLSLLGAWGRSCGAAELEGGGGTGQCTSACWEPRDWSLQWGWGWQGVAGSPEVVLCGVVVLGGGLGGARQCPSACWEPWGHSLWFCGASGGGQAVPQCMLGAPGPCGGAMRGLGSAPVHAVLG